MKQREEFLATKTKLQEGRIRKTMEEVFTWVDEDRKRHCSNRWEMIEWFVSRHIELCSVADYNVVKHAKRMAIEILRKQMSLYELKREMRIAFGNSADIPIFRQWCDARDSFIPKVERPESPKISEVAQCIGEEVGKYERRYYAKFGNGIVVYLLKMEYDYAMFIE